MAKKKSAAGDILATFTRHVAAFGYDGASFGAIAKELDLAQGTIVHHFGSKANLLLAVQETYVKRRLAELELLVSRLDNPSERLAAALHLFMGYHEHDREITVASAREIVRLAEEKTMASPRKLRARYQRMVRDLIQDGVDAKVFRAVDADVQVLFVLGAVQWAWTWYRPKGKVKAVAAASTLVDLVLGSLLNDRAPLAALAAANGRAAKAAAAVMKLTVRSVSEISAEERG